MIGHIPDNDPVCILECLHLMCKGAMVHGDTVQKHNGRSVIGSVHLVEHRTQLVLVKH